MGSGYGPIVVAPEAMSLDDLRQVEIAVPGRMTTAFLVLKLVLGDYRYREVPFDQILDEVRSGAAEAGLLIHEGQLTYEAEGLKKVVDLGEWWLLETGLPLPLGVNVARRDLGPEVLPELSAVLADSIRAGLENREEAMAYAMRFGRGLDAELADRFVGMYVNELTQDYGDEGRAAVGELLRRAEAAGAFSEPVRVEFVV
jgi:1,4-dihydroxy-6-naphthoate synthase